MKKSLNSILWFIVAIGTFVSFIIAQYVLPIMLVPEGGIVGSDGGIGLINFSKFLIFAGFPIALLTVIFAAVKMSIDLVNKDENLKNWNTVFISLIVTLIILQILSIIFAYAGYYKLTDGEISLYWPLVIGNLAFCFLPLGLMFIPLTITNKKSKTLGLDPQMIRPN